MDTIRKLNLKGHLLTAISYLIPIVCGAGFLVAIGSAMGGENPADLTGNFSIWDALATIGGTALGLLPVVISTGISYSIAEKVGIAPGFIVGLTANAIEAGFIGGLLGGFIAGYITILIVRFLKVPEWAKGLMPTLVIPFLSALVSGLIMVYIIGTPISAFTTWLTGILNSLNSSSILVFGIVVGLLSAVDYGGPINKTVFAFVLTLQAEGINEPITALQLVNTATPIGFGLAHLFGKVINKQIYTSTEVETLKSTVPMGVVNVVEGVIPLAMNDIIRSVIASAVGGAAGGAVSMTLGADSTVPFGGVLMLPTMSRPMAGVLALLANIVVTALVLVVIKKKLSPEDLEAQKEIEEEDIDLNDIQIS
ncbi:phosphotransferase system enzyme IIC component [Tetragenococcus halophilus subsp. halophilus]|uniref:Phosphotransferase system enzyme IIC component n=1 Tax=Tetragenococcus halophilus (strain DSM 20338 / JCM 20259 / NCIMB 9735 / NBRC 12172) TaxID=945021 RepID=A0AAN1SG38_TETHN|nr:PTS fructose transporter subunit IIC [Tetragenococcus halophilus]RQD29416.1 PTS fructose transporter subunit IIC [Tetragenococcus halophilus subsp. halophilus DSM 20339]WJS81554.1 PTS fructose transporter subunit IIC [Tetragenococcus halophilus]BAK93941.1 phosphotransferase system enzyme IIC component [Tetragenococcus halophilus NBRC 12172]GBD59182.1 phosphotransferase system enzyme IIC component [Tetragenococcus halophilus subsp. halophilus]GBD60998.1 phosphotransferase system enzyme IIC c